MRRRKRDERRVLALCRVKQCSNVRTVGTVSPGSLTGCLPDWQPYLYWARRQWRERGKIRQNSFLWIWWSAKKRWVLIQETISFLIPSFWSSLASQDPSWPAAPAFFCSRDRGWWFLNQNNLFRLRGKDPDSGLERKDPKFSRGFDSRWSSFSCLQLKSQRVDYHRMESRIQYRRAILIV